MENPTLFALRLHILVLKTLQKPENIKSGLTGRALKTAICDEYKPHFPYTLGQQIQGKLKEMVQSGLLNVGKTGEKEIINVYTITPAGQEYLSHPPDPDTEATRAKDWANRVGSDSLELKLLGAFSEIAALRQLPPGRQRIAADKLAAAVQDTQKHDTEEARITDWVNRVGGDDSLEPKLLGAFSEIAALRRLPPQHQRTIAEKLAVTVREYNQEHGKG